MIRVPGPVVRSFEAGPDGLEVLAFGEIDPSDAEIVGAESDTSAPDFVVLRRAASTKAGRAGAARASRGCQ